ncbi:hypothetical protein MKW92_009462 [Papaver armeniacum]|nr:hypothetical protein MKW92_009462 [Papaver armeniacum]
MDDETTMERPKRLGSETSEPAFDDETPMETSAEASAEADMDYETAIETPKRLGSEKELQSRSTFIPNTPAKKTKNRKRDVDSDKNTDSKSSKIPKTGKLPDLCHMTRGEIKISGKLRIMRAWEEKNLKTGKLYNYKMILMIEENENIPNYRFFFTELEQLEERYDNTDLHCCKIQTTMYHLYTISL